MPIERIPSEPTPTRGLPPWHGGARETHEAQDHHEPEPIGRQGRDGPPSARTRVFWIGLGLSIVAWVGVAAWWLRNAAG